MTCKTCKHDLPLLGECSAIMVRNQPLATVPPIAYCCNWEAIAQPGPEPAPFVPWRGWR